MTFQWTLIAGLLYTEMAMAVLLCLPFIKTSTWQRIFRCKLSLVIKDNGAIVFYIITALLVLMFADAGRAVYKGTLNEHELEVTSNVHVRQEIKMKLFRSQRNMYIAGFTILLWIVIRRLCSLVSCHATLVASNEATAKQAQGAAAAAQALMAENDELKAGTLGDESPLISELQESKATLANAREDLRKALLEVDAMKSQSQSLSKEYDRLADEHSVLQQKHDHGDKKDD